MKKFLLVCVSVLFITSQAHAATEGYNQSREKAFVKPGINTIFTAPENWPSNNNIAPQNRAPKGAKSFAVVLGSSYPAPNPYRYGPSFAVISNGYPYFIDCGEGTWRAMSNAALVNGDWMTKAFDLNNMKHLFLTHLHSDHTVGIPSWILNAYKYGSKASKEIYGPEGTKSMIDYIMQAWVVDLKDIQEGLMKSPKGGATTVVHEVNKDGLIFEDKNVKVYAYNKPHGLMPTYAYRFECADGRVFAFTADGPYSSGAVKAAMNADVVFIEAFSKESVGETIWADGEDPEKLALEYHLWPEKIADIQKESKAKSIVLIHEQDFTPADKYTRTGLLEESIRAGVKAPLFNGIDGDVY